MIARIHQKLGTAGFVISIVALVAALCGGAYAAGGGLTGKQKKEVTKIAKKYAGKSGAPGANGTNGTNGAKGDTGATGAEGKQGPEGKPGERGEKGEKGDEGEQGPEGSPWTAGGVLPEEKTETGTWSFFGAMPSGAFTGGSFASISFPIPLSERLFKQDVHPVGFPKVQVGFGPESACTGSVAEPTAPPGALCIYAGEVNEPKLVSTLLPDGVGEGVGQSGAIMWFSEADSSSYGFGSWALTAG